MGGLGLPNIELYHMAFELSKISRCWKLEQDLPKYLELEMNTVTPFKPLHILSQKTTEYSQNPIFCYSKEVWQRTHKIMKKSPYLQKYSSIWNNPKVCIGKKSIFWENWVKEGVYTHGDLHKDNVFISFDELCTHHNLSGKDAWKYMQIKNCVTIGTEEQENGANL